ncbi:MAG: uridine phosphorylase, partial [Natronomonas sp.]
GLRGGAVCTVYADRTTGEFEVTGEQRAARTASKAVSLLAEMDERVEKSGTSAWHAKLGLE